MKNKKAVSELAFLFKLLPVMQEVESVDRIYRLLLAITTTVKTIVYDRAMLFVVDEGEGVICGRYGISYSGDEDKPDSTFEGMARRVFAAYENIEGDDLTVKVRSFSVPMVSHHSAMVKAAKSGYPVLADRSLSEYADDPAFDFFETERYVAVPMKFNDRVTSVLVADMVHTGHSSADDVSLVYSLSQQASAAAQHLLDISSHKRKSRILFKVNQILGETKNRTKFEEGLKLALIMLTRAVGASGCFLKDLTREKTLHIKSVHEYSPNADDDDIIISESFEELLDRAAGRIEVLGGGDSHSLLGAAAKSVRFFYVCPLVAGGNVIGAIAVYTDTDSSSLLTVDYEARDKNFVQLVAGIVGAHLRARETEERITRAEELLQELGSNLARERDLSRRAESSAEYYSKVAGGIKNIRKHLAGEAAPAKRLEKITQIIDSMQKQSAMFKQRVLAKAATYSLVDIFKLTQRIVDDWQARIADKSIEVTVRIPDQGPSLLMDEEKISLAIGSILDATATYLAKGHRMSIECSTSDDRVLLCFADNGEGLPGDIISRLFMPFQSAAVEDEKKRALSLAGEVIQKHSGEIMIKSSHSWKTILILSFPGAANRDRRKIHRERRRPQDRRLPVKTG